MGSKSILGYPGHAYAPGNDSPTPWGCHTPVSRLGRRWAGTHSTIHFIKIDKKFIKILEIYDFEWFVVNFDEIHGTVSACSAPVEA